MIFFTKIKKEWQALTTTQKVLVAANSDYCAEALVGSVSAIGKPLTACRGVDGDILFVFRRVHGTGGRIKFYLSK